MSTSIALSIDKSVLIAALSDVQSVVSNRNVIAILNNVVLTARGGNLTITATDMDIRISKTVTAEIKTEGVLTVNAKAFHDIIRRMPDETIKIDGKVETGRMQIKSGTCKFSVPCLDAFQFPDMSFEETATELPISSQDLIYILTKTQFAAAIEETKYNLLGVNIQVIEEGVMAVASNGAKLARALVPMQNVVDFPAFTIPSKTIGMIVKVFAKPVANFKILFTEAKLLITADGVELTSKLIADPFPQVNFLFEPVTQEITTVNRESLLKSVDRIVLACDEKTRSIKVKISTDSLILCASSETMGDAEEFIDIKYLSEPETIGLNAKYFNEILSHMEGNDVNIQFCKNKPCVITNPDAPNEIYLLMGMKI